MAALIIVSTFGCINGIILAGARIYYAMAKDGLFFKQVGELNQQGVPRNALVFQCLWAALLTLSGKYGDLLDYVIFAVLIFYVLTMIGLFVLRRKQPQAERPGGDARHHEYSGWVGDGSVTPADAGSTKSEFRNPKQIRNSNGENKGGDGSPFGIFLFGF